MDALITLQLVLSTLVYPGLLFLMMLAFLTQYLVRKISARYQRRMGPAYVGPYGILQPLADFWKLLRAKEVVKSRYSMQRVAEVSLLIGVASITASMLILPLGFLSIQSPMDFLVFFYMSSVMPILMLTIASLSMPGPYTSLGVSRLLSILTISEPVYFTGLFIPCYIATFKEPAVLSVAEASMLIPRLWVNPATILILVFSLIALLASIQAKAMYPPFNIPEAEQEIIAGFETEFSGPLLALATLLHDMDLTVSLLAVTFIVLGGPAPFNAESLGGVVAVVLKYVALLTVVATIKNIYGRYRLEQALHQLVKYGGIPAILSLLLTVIWILTP
ncbi:MAG: NADH-quinone oxidoreductase subunit H [Desulfurococcus sp.]|nr:NADH-quinone oxidoreductase subunit H [Desulfurococcus sp.]